MNSFSDIMDLLRADMNKLKNNISKYTIQEITNDLYEECQSAINDFYSQYEPKHYYRHYNFRKSFKKYKSHNSYIGGIELLEDSLPNVYKGRNSSPESVFWRVYLGFHGIATMQGYAPFMKPSPIERLYQKRDEIIQKKDMYFNNALNKALSDSYNIIG